MFLIDFESLDSRNVINYRNNIIAQAFKIILRIDTHFEVMKWVQIKLIIFNPNNMKLLYMVIYQQRE